MASSSSGQHVIDIDKLSDSTRKKLEMLRLRPLSSKCCIYKVPHGSRRLNEHVYTPKVVSIGPIHNQKKELRAMEEHKQRYLQDFLQLSKASLKECFQIIQMNETRLRNCYADIIDLNSENFLEMVLVDAAFLIMVFLRDYFELSSLLSSTERMFEKPIMMHDIRYDIVLLENQVPFFILEELFKLSKIQNILIEHRFDLSELPSDFNEETAMIILAYRFLKRWNIIKISERIPPSKAEHILDLLRSCLIPENWGPERKETKTMNIPSVKELHQAGVRFQVGSEENMFDITFANGILEIPLLRVYDSTEVVFQNLLAFELCHRLDRIFSDYFDMMQRFTISSADVELLIHNEVIENGLSNAEGVSTLFHHISSSNLISTSHCYSDVITGLSEYYGVTWHRWKASLKQKYFKAPWAIFSVVAAVLLLLLTIVQTVCCILQVT